MLEVKNLSKSFEETGTLFENVNLNLSPGEIIFLKGKCGSGKSQFLKAIVLLTAVEKGQIYFKNEKICEENLPKMRSLIHFVAQNFSAQGMTVEEFLNEPLKFKIYKDIKIDFKGLFKDFHLKDSFLKKRISLLSGGEKQMAHLIRSLSLNPEILLLDEPISAMDPETKELALKVILKYLKEGGAVIWVTHDPPLLEGRVLKFPEFI